MGQSESIPMHLMQPPRYSRHHNLERPGGFMNLYWRLAFAPEVVIRLEVDVALCFGDVCRVLQVLAADDAELDDVADPSMRTLLPVQHKRLVFVDGMLAADKDNEHGRRTALAIFAASTMDANRQIGEHGGLQRESTIHVIIRRQSLWLALPRPPEGIAAAEAYLGRRSPWLWLRSWWYGSQTATASRPPEDDSGWALPAGWDRGLQEVVANHDQLQLTGRATYIRRMLEKAPLSHNIHSFIEADDGMRLIDRRNNAAGQGALDGGVGLIDALMANVTDNINDPPLDYYVCVRPPASAKLYAGTAVEFTIHMQLPPTFPLSSERCRMLTPILHPLVVPLWDDDDDDYHESGVVRLDGGRMAHTPVTPSSRTRSAMVFEFSKALIDPVACAALIISSRPSDADARVRRWATNANGEMEAKARRLASKSGRIRWRPELHGVCPRAFRVEVRTLLLVLQRLGGYHRHNQDDDEEDNEGEDEDEDKEEEIVPLLPREVIWLVIDALLERHLLSGSLLFT